MDGSGCTGYVQSAVQLSAGHWYQAQMRHDRAALDQADTSPGWKHAWHVSKLQGLACMVDSSMRAHWAWEKRAVGSKYSVDTTYTTASKLTPKQGDRRLMSCAGSADWRAVDSGLPWYVGPLQKLPAEQRMQGETWGTHLPKLLQEKTVGGTLLAARLFLLQLQALHVPAVVQHPARHSSVTKLNTAAQ